MYYIGLDVHKKTISYCAKDGSGRIYAEGSIPATRLDLPSELMRRASLRFIQRFLPIFFPCQPNNNIEQRKENQT
jgi:hypothetical protein